MATQGQRRILRIVDKLENLNDTQIAFEDVRSDKQGLSYFGGAFGGKYDGNNQSWGNSITRFARYNSSPIFKSLIFDQDLSDSSQSQQPSTKQNIILTTLSELTAKGGTNAGPGDIYDRGHLSINIGNSAGANTDPDNIIMGVSNINIGEYAGRNSKSLYPGTHVNSPGGGINIGHSAGIGCTNHYSILLGYYVGSGSVVDRSVCIGVGAGAGNMISHYGVCIGMDSRCAGDRVISIGMQSGLSQTGNNINVINIGFESGYLSNGNKEGTIFIGHRAGTESYDNYKSIFMGEETGRSSRTAYSVNIGHLAGNNTQGSVSATGDVFIGRMAGHNYQPMVPDLTYPWYTDLIDDNGVVNYFNGFNVGVGSQSLATSRGSFNIGLGYLAGGLLGGSNGSNVGNTSSYHNICIGAASGYGVAGSDNIFIGLNAGSPQFTPIGSTSGASGAILLGRSTGISSDGTTPSEIRVLANGMFEIGMQPSYTNNGGVNYRYTNMLFVGNINDEWVSAGGYFGLAPLDDDNIDAMGDPRKGFMYFDVQNDANIPKYFDGTDWQSFGGGFTGLSDTPGSYTEASRVLSINSSNDGVAFSNTLFTDTTTPEGYRTWIENGTFEVLVNKDVNSKFMAMQLESREYDSAFYPGASYIHAYYDYTTPSGYSGDLNLEADGAVNLNCYNSITGQDGIHFRRAIRVSDDPNDVEYITWMSVTSGPSSKALVTIDGEIAPINLSAAPAIFNNGAKMYSMSGEMYVLDSSGNSTQISPHDENGEWVYNSKNIKTNKHIKVNMEKLIRFLETYHGKQFIEEIV